MTKKPTADETTSLIEKVTGGSLTAISDASTTALLFVCLAGVLLMMYHFGNRLVDAQETYLTRQAAAMEKLAEINDKDLAESRVFRQTFLAYVKQGEDK